MKEDNRKAWINLGLLAATLGVNTLGALGVINGMSQKAVSDSYPTLITPSPETFSIWSLIYSLLLLSFIMMAVRGREPYYRTAQGAISRLFWLSCLFNMAWIISFSYELVEISVVFILGLVLVLARLCEKLSGIQTGRAWLLPTAFGLYGGWLFIATVVNIAAALVKTGWNRFGLDEALWASVILGVSVVLVAAVAFKVRNAVFPLPVAWAYLGISRALDSQGFPLVETTALAGMAVLIAIAGILFYRLGFHVAGSAPGRFR